MELKNWVIDAFPFQYNNMIYSVLIKIKDTYPFRDGVLAKIVFIKETNEKIEVEASENKLMIDAQTLRKFLGIKWSKNLGNILRQFTYYFGEHIPTRYNDNKTTEEKNLVVTSLSISNQENPNKIYCYSVRRNGKKQDGTNKSRSVFNSNKTRILRPDLYNEFKTDSTISFCYSEDVNAEKTLRDIVINFNNNN